MPLLSRLPITIALAALLAAPLLLPAQATPARRPVLSFPDPRLDDTTAYQGYATQLHRDAAGNAVQAYVDRRADRVVFVWGDSENESLGFSARDADGAAAALTCGTCRSIAGRDGRARTLTVRYAADGAVTLGWFVLGSMRVERDLQYLGWARRPFGTGRITVPEVDSLVAHLARLDAPFAQPFLHALGADSTGTLRRRLVPTYTVLGGGSRWRWRVVQPTLDGLDTLRLTITIDPATVIADPAGDHVTLRPVAGRRDVAFDVTVATTTAPLTPIARRQLFAAPFLAWAARTQRRAPAAVAQRLERDLRSVELLSSREKLFAGLPTYATYFGRDLLVSTMMMRDVWQPAVTEAVIGAVLRKLSPTGEVSHEESLGGQATREAAAEAIALLDAASRAPRPAVADTLRARALAVVRAHRRPREAYHMVDDEYQLPVVVAQWMDHPDVSDARQRAFLAARAPDGTSRAARLVRALAVVAQRTAPYAAAPAAQTLVSFAPRDTGWGSASWRDSGAGYAGGRYPMDVNAIWVPAALTDLGRILAAMRRLGLPVDALVADAAQVVGDSTLALYARDPARLDRAIETWRGAARWFVVTPDAGTSATGPALPFLAVALDAAGRPIPVMNTDPATRLFLAHGDERHRGLSTPEDDARDLPTFTTRYPRGLLVPGIGPVVANDVFATPAIQAWFTRDPYHGPRVVWGREVNLFLLGAAGRLRAAPDAPDAPAWRDALETVRAAAAASGFHAELWSYDVVGGATVPRRYGSGGDLQLWSTTELAVQYALAQLGTAQAGPTRSQRLPSRSRNTRTVP